MSTGYDELYYAASNYGQNQKIVDEHEGNIGDAQELCSDAAEIIHSLRRSNDELYEALDHAMIVLFDVAKTSGLTHSDAISCAIAAQDALAKARGEM